MDGQGLVFFFFQRAKPQPLISDLDFWLQHQSCPLCSHAPDLKDRDGDGPAVQCHRPARQPPASLQMAGSAGWFAYDQVRLKPQSLWLPAAVISHTVSDPIIASPPTHPTSSV